MRAFINGPKFFSNFSRSTRKQELKFGSVAEIKLVKKTNDFDFDLGAQEIQQIGSKGPFFLHIYWVGE